MLNCPVEPTILVFDTSEVATNELVILTGPLNCELELTVNKLVCSEELDTMADAAKLPCTLTGPFELMPVLETK